jgi:hypothetical protein
VVGEAGVESAVECRPEQAGAGGDVVGAGALMVRRDTQSASRSESAASNGGQRADGSTRAEQTRMQHPHDNDVFPWWWSRVEVQSQNNLGDDPSAIGRLPILSP